MNNALRISIAACVTVASACAMDLRIDPEGYRCNTGNQCPEGFTCLAEVCTRVVAPPECGACSQAPVCVGTVARTFVGACDAGACSFSPVDTACDAGCTNGACLDSCRDVVCVTPPPPSCAGATLRTFAMAGTCAPATGTCEYAVTEFSCSNGCSAGRCLDQNVCMGVVCTSPPSDICFTPTTLRRFTSPGSCEPGTGACSYAPMDTTCTAGCVGGACVPPPLTFLQVGPRIPFAINAIDLAPSSSGDLMLAVGDDGAVARWNGSAWNVLTTPSTADMRAVHFVSPSTAYLVGANRTVWTYRNNTVAAVSGVPGSASASLVGVFGRSETNVLVIDDVGTWWKWNGVTWATGFLGNTPFETSSVFIDETNRERIGGRCGSGHATCVAYRNPATSSSWLVDADTDTEGCAVLGPWVDVPAMGVGPDALCGKPSNELVRHATSGVYSSTGVPLLPPGGGGVVGLAGGPTMGPGRTVFALTASTGSSARGQLLRLTPSSVGSVAVDSLLDLFSGEEHLSLNESNGVVVADVRRPELTNTVIRRGSTTRDAYDLGDDLGALTVTPTGELVVVTRQGDLAIRRAGSSLSTFFRGPTLNVRGAEGRNGTSFLLVGGAVGSTAGALFRVSTTGASTAIPVTGTTAAFNAVCRVSDTEAYAVGGNGLIVLIDSAAGTATRMTSQTTKALLAVDCGGGFGPPVACGNDGTVLTLSASGWGPVTPTPPSTAHLSSCRRAASGLWLAGDNVLLRLDSGASQWTPLAGRSGLEGLQVRGLNEAYGFANTGGNFDVVRYDGRVWTSVLTAAGALVGGVQISGMVVYGGAHGVLVEGR